MAAPYGRRVFFCDNIIPNCANSRTAAKSHIAKTLREIDLNPFPFYGKNCTVFLLVRSGISFCITLVGKFDCCNSNC